MNHIQIHFHEKTGKRVMPLHGFNSGPMTKVFTYDARPQFVEGGFPFVRLHDVEYPYGSGEFVDIPCIFKNFDADENDPASYHFANTDEYIRQSLNVGAKIIFRLGVSIEHSPYKRYIDPPKDFGKWARICEHIVRHYNEGWADGHRWNIEYWEIWNEPDLHSEEAEHVKQTTWGGDVDQFVEFYTVAARHLKACFPHLKIGGCGFATAKRSFITEFYRQLSQKSPRVPLDFHSWHRYDHNPANYIPDAAYVRKMLCEFGYGEVESILDEWNLMYKWGPRENQRHAYPAMKDHRGAAFYAGTLCALQEKTDVAIATNFEADIVKEFCGIFNVDGMCIGGLTKGEDYFATVTPTPGFYAFKSFNSLYRLGEQVALSCDNERLFATAAAGEDGVGTMVANVSDEATEVTLTLTGVRGPICVRITDERRTNEKLLTLSAEGELTLTLPLAPQSFAYIGTDLPDPVANY